MKLSIFQRKITLLFVASLLSLLPPTTSQPSTDSKNLIVCPWTAMNIKTYRDSACSIENEESTNKLQ